MTKPIIRVENISKKFIIGHQVEVGAIQGGFPTLRDRIIHNTNWLKNQALSRLTGKQIASPAYQEFWALKDVSFEIQRGDRVGIIGRNGAGKSTLLKILSRITEPTAGQIILNGRVASLLEVGTGFHPELTGRENIYLNGAILGMSKLEIKRKFDEIVDFAEVEKFLDTPVKRYSSGMYVRLAFAVAAYLEPEILIVDEVLAVGDLNFQKKCLGKMQDVSQTEGRTVLFVSHNMDAIQRLCSRCILLEKGQLVADGNTADAVQQYLSRNSYQASPNRWIDVSKAMRRQGTGKARFVTVNYSSLNEEVAHYPYPDGPLEFSLAIESDSAISVIGLAVNIFNQSGTLLVNADLFGLAQTIELQKGHNIVKLRIEELHLKSGIYVLGLWLAGNEPLDHIEYAFEIEVVESISERSNQYLIGPITCKFSFQ